MQNNKICTSANRSKNYCYLLINGFVVVGLLSITNLIYLYIVIRLVKPNGTNQAAKWKMKKKKNVIK